MERENEPAHRAASPRREGGDPTGCVAMCTDDVVHDVVGSPTGPLHGTDAARGLYDMLTGASAV